MFGQYTCLGSQCPPKNKFNLVPQFYPALPEQVQNAPAGGQQAEDYARNTNAQIRQQLQAEIAATQGAAIYTELVEIYAALEEVYNWILSVKPPFPEAAALFTHRQAEKMIKDAIAEAPITPDIEQQILQQTIPFAEPEPSFIRRNALPLFLGGGVLLLGIIGMFLMLKV